MPTYQYRCAKCGEQFELWQSIHDDALERHPGCGGKVARVLAPAGIVLKGSGFYRTDSRVGNGKRDAAEKSGETPAEKVGAGSANEPSSGDGKNAKSDTSAGKTTPKPDGAGSKPSKRASKPA